jgi:hypothetical protein
MRGYDMNSYFLPYEEVVKLEELGFDRPCFTYYTKQKLCYDLRLQYKNLSSPFYSQVFNWFLEVFNVKGNINLLSSGEYTWVYIKDEKINKSTIKYKLKVDAEIALVKKLIKLHEK